MSERVYDIFAIIGRLIIPAIATLYFSPSQIWGLPLGEQICGTLAALTVFINTILRIEYNRWEDEQDFDDLVEDLTHEDEDDH